MVEPPQPPSKAVRTITSPVELLPMEMRAKATEAMDGLLDHTAFVANSEVSASKVVGGFVGGLSLLHFIAPGLVEEAFALVPHHTVFSPVAWLPIPFLWNLMTSSFFEGGVLLGAIAAPSAWFLTRALERLWATRSIVMHLAFTTTSAGAGLFVLQILKVHSTQRERDFFVAMQGCPGLLVALAVALRHAYPFEAVLPAARGLQYQHLPFAITAFFCLVGFIAPSLYPEWSLAPFAMFFGWLYIRYLMWGRERRGGRIRGVQRPQGQGVGVARRELQLLVGCYRENLPLEEGRGEGSVAESRLPGLLARRARGAATRLGQ
eukprot:TRINITY_DN11617_c1_g1_i1.p1 TRINITY_DN11617_c1_g1~~TRINITY_DN11617_c1_g1_i1.p1  ORF type:complete len:320 (+),score=39.34 TRINITY_DN11617_c1_g1_i1:136-1095(+)